MKGDLKTKLEHELKNSINSERYGFPPHFLDQVFRNFVFQVDTSYSSVAQTLQSRGI